MLTIFLGVSFGAFGLDQLSRHARAGHEIERRIRLDLGGFFTVFGVALLILAALGAA